MHAYFYAIDGVLIGVIFPSYMGRLFSHRRWCAYFYIERGVLIFTSLVGRLFLHRTWDGYIYIVGGLLILYRMCSSHLYIIAWGCLFLHRRWGAFIFTS